MMQVVSWAVLSKDLCRSGFWAVDNSLDTITENWTPAGEDTALTGRDGFRDTVVDTVKYTPRHWSVTLCNRLGADRISPGYLHW
jgi:hypothetical protein